MVLGNVIAVSVDAIVLKSFKAHVKYLDLCKALLMYSSSL